MAVRKELKVYEVQATKNPGGGYKGEFVIAQDDENVLEFSNIVRQEPLGRYEEFVMARVSDNKVFVATRLLIDGDSTPTRYDENHRLLGYPYSRQIFRFSCENFS